MEMVQREADMAEPRYILYPGICLEVLRKTTKSRIGSVLAEIQT
jgi:hypothetical protein